MAAVDSALQTARIPALLMLLGATAIPVKDKLTAVRQLDTSLFWRPWVLASLVSVAFVVVMLAGRSRWHAWLLLLVEAGIAGTVAFVPPCTGCSGSVSPARGRSR